MGLLREHAQLSKTLGFLAGGPGGSVVVADSGDHCANALHSGLSVVHGDGVLLCKSRVGLKRKCGAAVFTGN
jgi:hypothetical protein